MLRAYQSPSSGTHCGLQCAQMPNFASWHHSGAAYCISESHVGLYGPSPSGLGIGACSGTASHEPPGMGSLGGLPIPVGLQVAQSNLVWTILPPVSI